MNKWKYSKFAMPAIVAIAVSLSSCSDDDDTPMLDIPNGEKTEIVLDCNDKFVSLPISSNGKWKAYVVDNGSDDTDWIALIKKEGNGNEVLQVAVDYNETGITRNAVVRFSNGKQTVDYTINQGVNNDSEDGENSANDSKYHNTGIGKGLSVKAAASGGGADYESLLKSQIFNYSAMKEVDVKDVPDLVTEELGNRTSISFSDFNSLQNQEKSIKANLNVDISYGLFKLGLSGNFNMYGSEKDTISTYAATASIPRSTLRMDYELLASDYAPWSPNINDTINAKRLHLFSSTFINIHDIIEKYVSEKKTIDDPQLLKELNKLDKKFGPVFTTMVKKGGSVDIDFQVKNMESIDTLKIGGKLTASFNSLFSLKAEAAADYFNASHSFMEGSTLNITVNGGELSSLPILANALKATTSKDGYNTEHMLQAVITWAEGVTVTNGVIINVSVAGIWELFSEEAGEVLKEFFKNKYPNNQDGTSPYLFNVAAMADE